MAEERASMVETEWRFDPVADLPGDLAAICLSFLRYSMLLCDAQLVSRTWRNAIDGGLPAVWHHVSIPTFRHVADDELAVVARKSRLNTRALKLRVSGQGLQYVIAMASLRVLHIQLVQCSITPVLPHLHLLEDLSVYGISEPWPAIAFPTLPCLHIVSCRDCGSVSGLRNLSALTKLEMRCSSMHDGDAWPASLRDVIIYEHKKCKSLLGLIAALQHPVRLATDWSFTDFFEPSPDLFSSLSGLCTLQQLVVKDESRSSNHLLTLMSTSLRHLRLKNLQTNDQAMQRVAQLTNLQYLKINQDLEMSSMGLFHVCTLPNLTSLCLKYCVSIIDYSPIEQCSQLRELIIHFYTHPATLVGRSSPTGLSAITRLQHLEKLQLKDPPTTDHHFFSQLCNLHQLRDLDILIYDLSICKIIPAATFAYLPTLRHLDTIRLPRVDDVSVIVDYLVQMPQLRSVTVNNRLSFDDRSRLRDSLPRLEKLVL